MHCRRVVIISLQYSEVLLFVMKFHAIIVHQLLAHTWRSLVGKLCKGLSSPAYSCACSRLMYRRNTVFVLAVPCIRITFRLSNYCYSLNSDRIQGYSMEQEFCMTRLDWGLDYTQSVWNVQRTGNNVVLNENSVERKPCTNRKSKSLELTI